MYVSTCCLCHCLGVCVCLFGLPISQGCSMCAVEVNLRESLQCVIVQLNTTHQKKHCCILCSIKKKIMWPNY